ncbi:helix-turn-helix domain-containing protein [Streptomyces phyllanthi]|uniref:helix-turn-helix domain-containing protein n=1 Tax=Streptomyces phyllanthi TaxID=1803180 RepID=UPI002AD4C32A|nr:helix-turn-helix domain-containing protein [Streptomyces phyllanthi]
MQPTGVSPRQWLLTARVNRARELLQASDLGIEQIAAQAGLGSGTNLRARFRDVSSPRPPPGIRHEAGVRSR